ncbi:hypothetical protein pb186bvf_019907 [Paramecium bursaria]
MDQDLKESFVGQDQSVRDNTLNDTLQLNGTNQIIKDSQFYEVYNQLEDNKGENTVQDIIQETNELNSSQLEQSVLPKEQLQNDEQELSQQEQEEEQDEEEQQDEQQANKETTIHEEPKPAPVQESDNHEPQPDTENIYSSQELKEFRSKSQQYFTKQPSTDSAKRFSLLSLSLNTKDQLIQQLQQQLQAQTQQNLADRLDYEDQIRKSKTEHQEDVGKLHNRIRELEKLLKEKDNDLEQYKNGNQTLHLQDLSAISIKHHLKSNQNDKKDLTLFDVLNEKHSTADLSELGNNFWLISAERKIQQTNPLYKDFMPKEQKEEKGKIINHPTKKYEKSYWFKYVEPTVRRPIPRLQNIQLPKIQEKDDKQNLLQTAPQPIPFSQKLANPHTCSSVDAKGVKNFNSSMPHFSPNQIQIDQDDFIADQEIQQLFGLNQHKIDWEQQPLPISMIKQSSQKQLNEQKFPHLQTKLSYLSQYSNKREFQDQSGSKIWRYKQ